jgi:hypothetical protein
MFRESLASTEKKDAMGARKLAVVRAAFAAQASVAGPGESSHAAKDAHVRAGWESSAAGGGEVRECASRYFNPDPVL